MGTPLTSSTTAASSFCVGPLEIPMLEFGICSPSTYALETCLISPSTNAVCVTRVPPVIRRDRPLDIELDIRGLHPDSYAAATVAHSFSVHAIFVAILEGQAQTSSFTAQVSVFPSDVRWIARILTTPSSWENAELANVSITLGQQLLPCEVLRATLRVGYNHDSAPAGAVLAAAKAGDVPALQAALDAGGSTEEADAHNGCTAVYWAAANGHLEVIRALVAAGANPATPSKFSGMPLHAAATHNHADIIALLLKTPGVDPLATFGFGLTALDLALTHKRTVVVALLKADPRVAAALAAKARWY